VNDIDQIPWQDLTHAYGSAADVPDLLRALRASSPELHGDDSPLWQLFGNIWHQGTVYEATAYAVPFLIELAVDRRTPDRVGILSLLVEIARGSSYRDVHGNLLKEADFLQKKNKELTWARRAHDAVAAGFTHFVNLAKEPGDVAFAAAHVLVQLPDHGTEAAAIIRSLLRHEQRIAYRAGLLLLFGLTADASQETLAVFDHAVNSIQASERHAAAFSIASLKIRPLSECVCKVIVDAIASDELEATIQDLPCQALSNLNSDQLFACLDLSHQHEVTDGLTAALESGKATVHQVSTLVNLLFPLNTRGSGPRVTVAGMNPRQFRAVRALYESMKGGKRIFYGHFPCWGLPDSMRDWRELASGREPSPMDERLPLLATASHPGKACAPGKLKVGQKVLHRHFGPGKVTDVKIGGPFTELTIHFDDEGVKQLSLPTNGSHL
jgi:hypothetical protein